MFDFDWFREIVSTIRKNKMRTALTGFAVAWGIFMLIILLAAGNGLYNGMDQQFASRAKNAVKIWGGHTSRPYNGLPTNRSINFDQRDLDMLRSQMPEIEYISAGIGRSVVLEYNNEYASSYIEGMTSEGAYINNLSVFEGNGRFINALDDARRRKVIVLHPNHVKILFKDEDPIGKYVTAGKIMYRVIGVYHTEDKWDDDPSAYIPLSLAQILYNRGWGYWHVEFTVKGLDTIEDNDAFKLRLRQKMGRLHGFDPEDGSALYIRSSAEQAIQTGKMFVMIRIFILFVGMASLMAGIVGVGNIMLITVKERTREIGIRKSIGATPLSVLWLVIMESIFITTCAGYVGIVMGVGVTELVSARLNSAANPDQFSIFMNPTVDLETVFYALIFLVGCGVLAGLIPAMRATRISPIEAMRAE